MVSEDSGDGEIPCHLQSAAVSHTRRILLAIVLVATAATAQQAPSGQEQKPNQAQVRVNYLNVCTPPEADKTEIATTLDRLPAKPHFAVDYEISRGRSTLDEAGVVAGENARMSDAAPSISRWVRVRKEFPNSSPLTNVQYSFSVNEDKVVETLVFRMREQKDVISVSLSDSVVAPPVPSQVVTTSTPVDRIRLERFGKASVVLARCANADQSAYEQLFQKATSLLNLYRDTLGVRRIVPQELPGAMKATRLKSAH